MSNFNNDHAIRTARKEHRCSYCGEPIPSGDDYVWQKGRYDDHWFESKMHDECFEDLCDNGEGEYLLYSNDRPKREVMK